MKEHVWYDFVEDDLFIMVCGPEYIDISWPYIYVGGVMTWEDKRDAAAFAYWMRTRGDNGEWDFKAGADWEQQRVAAGGITVKELKILDELAACKVRCEEYREALDKIYNFAFHCGRDCQAVTGIARAVLEKHPEVR